MSDTVPVWRITALQRRDMASLLTGDGLKQGESIEVAPTARMVELEARVAELEAENARLSDALRVAADDLDKAANQFEGLRLSPFPVVNNADIFTAKSERARAALAATRKDAP